MKHLLILLLFSFASSSNNDINVMIVERDLASHYSPCETFVYLEKEKNFLEKKGLSISELYASHLYNKGTAYYYLRLDVEALKFLKKSLTLYKELGLTETAQLVKSEIKNFDNLKYGLKGTNSEIDQKKLKNLNYRQIGILALNSSTCKQAPLFLIAKKKLEKKGMTNNEIYADTLFELARAYGIARHDEKSIEYLNRALALYTKLEVTKKIKDMRSKINYVRGLPAGIRCKTLN